MRLLYNIGIFFYYLLIQLWALFNSKARLFVQGRKATFHLINEIDSNSNWIWFHTASLGEFEMARPVMETVKREFPDLCILLTFFSPSGYEVRKDYETADLVCYLPMDTPSNAFRFVKNFNIKLACFVKYDYWLNYLNALKEAEVPIINFSAQFRPEQLFFKPWGVFYRSFLYYFDHILVQNEPSNQLLSGINYPTGLVTGDTRFDRVAATNKETNDIPSIDQFKGKSRLIVFGSVWQQDLEIITPVIEQLILQQIRVIIAPHEIDSATIMSTLRRLPDKTILFSSVLGQNQNPNGQVLLVDTVGHLSAIYRYADIAYVGGAFRGKLHNILEPAVFAMPLIFGKDSGNKKFPEAVDLVNLGAATEVSSTKELNDKVQWLFTDDKEREINGQIAGSYVNDHKGASEKTMEIIRQYLTPQA